jgi:allantoate deiminase
MDTMMNINEDRLRKRIDLINSISADSTGGYTRMAFSDKNAQALSFAEKMMVDIGLSVNRDAAGNLFGTWPSGMDALGVVASGSHIDTVKNGGPLDGLLGVIGAIEAVNTIIEGDYPLASPLQVIVFADEEGARFGSGLIGSKSIAGTWQEADLSMFSDSDGILLADAMREFGADPGSLADAAARDGYYSAFVELHIEQGIMLENKRKRIGIVNGIKAPYWLRGAFVGEANHAGGTPMGIRRDALTAASNFAAKTERIAKEMGDPFVATIGVFSVTPGGINTIPGRVDYTLDIRDIDMERRRIGVRRILQAAEECSVMFGVTHECECIKDEQSKAMSPKVMNAIEEACISVNAPYMEIPSGAFHDSLPMAGVCDTGMIFIPSKDGISHSPQESSSWSDICLGVDILCSTLLTLAKQ